MVSIFRPKKIDLSAKGFRKIFGELEAHIMEIVWNRGRISIKEVREELAKRYKNLSFNAVMTVMNRLAEKGVLKKEREKGISMFSAKIDKEELGRMIAKDIISVLVEDPQIFSGVNFADIVSDLDKKALDKLRKFLDASKHRKKNASKKGK